MTLLLGAVPESLAAQETGTIRGTVRSAVADRPLPGAQVSVPGTGRGTLTNNDGEYLIPGIPTGSQTVRVNMIGYAAEEQTVTVSAAGAAVANFALDESAIALDGIVVTGTVGDTRRRSVGNAVAQIDAADIVETAPVNSMQDLLNARAPGVVIIPGSGTVGSGSRIRVRGISSLSLSQEPLIYVDGVRVNNAQGTGPINQGFGSGVISRINDFDPDNIESIEIIKGPAAATLYGTEASNGVIQIITKKGAMGAPRFNFGMRQGANWFANASGRIYTNYGLDRETGEIATISYDDLVALNGDIVRTGHMQQYDLDVSGGNEGVRYYIGGGWERNEGIEPSNELNRYNSRANITISPTQNFDVQANVGYVSGRTDLPLEAGGGGIFWTTYFSTPFNLGTPRNGFYSATPAAYAHAYSIWQDVDRFTGSIQLNHRPTDWFSQRFTAGTDLTNQKDSEIVERIEDPDFQFFFSPGTIRGYKETTARSVYYNTVDYSATIRTDPTPSISSSTSGGAQLYRRFSEFVFGYGEEFPARGLRTISAATGEKISAEDYVENTTVGVFLQQQLGFRDERMFLTAAVRADDNSAFGENFDLVTYPKVAGTWVISEEPFWTMAPVSALKLRAAYGESGQQPQSFAALRTFAPITGPNDGAAVTPQLVGNPDLGPERGREFELGFDAGFLDDRLGLEFTYYNQRTTDAILLKDIAPSTGFAGQQFINAGEIANTGVELLARALAFTGENAALDFTVGIATNDNEVIDLGLADTDFVSAGGFTQHREGFPVGSWFSRRLVDAEFDSDARLIAGSEICDDGQGGTIGCADAPTVFLGRPTPDLEGSFSSTLTLFNNLRFYGLIDFKQGYHKLDGNKRVRCILFRRCRENFFPEEFLDDPAWLAQTQRGGAFVDGLINDAGFAKLREVSASYTLPSQWGGRLGAERVQLTVSGRNLFTWTDYDGIEPEASFLGGGRGGGSAQWEQNVTPQLAQFIASVNVSF
jgi:TonB-linked SusC/RagA family outer membrane protein